MDTNGNFLLQGIEKIEKQKFSRILHGKAFGPALLVKIN